ncbi:hypothetical protein [Endozoicomonas sp. ALB091]|uniref:hypothetical protein n=1 Tax=Endozoicomonas sp. ALB091 TaxID=3403073 RepID=UPI003BB71141
MIYSIDLINGYSELPTWILLRHFVWIIVPWTVTIFGLFSVPRALRQHHMHKLSIPIANFMQGELLTDIGNGFFETFVNKSGGD